MVLVYEARRCYGNRVPLVLGRVPEYLLPSNICCGRSRDRATGG